MSKLSAFRKEKKLSFVFHEEESSEVYLKIPTSLNKPVKENVIRGTKTIDQLRFLSEVSAILSESLDIDEMLTSLSKIVTHNIADCFFVHTIDEKTKMLDRVFLECQEPQMAEKITEWRTLFPLKETDPLGVMNVIRTGKAELYSYIPDELLKAVMVPIENYNFIKKHIYYRSAMIVPLKYRGRVLGCVTFTWNKTEDYYDESDLSLAQDLAKRMAVAIENIRLFTKAQEASKAKSAFLANMSHEIRTPIGVIMGFVDLLKGTIPSDNQEAANYVSIIDRNSKQLLTLIDDILDLSKVEAEKINIHGEQFSFVDLLLDMRSIFALQAQKKNIQFKLNIDGVIPAYITTDFVRLKQILTNIVGNAVKFTDRGYVELLVKYEDDKLVFNVKDTGTGITQDQTDLLFKPFSQVDYSSTRKFGGTGLGLVLSKKLAIALGGDVELKESVIGKGSVFSVVITPIVPEGCEFVNSSVFCSTPLSLYPLSSTNEKN